MAGIVCTIAACAHLEAPGQFSSTKTTPSPFAALFAGPNQIDQTFERAPELFRVSGTARWNGGDTVGGVWVTHPDARASRRIRIVNTQSGIETDGMLYKADKTGPQDAVVVSSDAAKALGLAAGQPTLLSLFGLRPKSAANKVRAAAPEPVYGVTNDESARSELVNHVARMSNNQILRMVAAAVRGMGYATQFETEPEGARGIETAPSHILAFPGVEDRGDLQPLRFLVRDVEAPAADAEEIRTAQTYLKKLGETGAIVSISGFANGAQAAVDPDGAHVQLIDRDLLITLWTANYEQLSVPDQGLLPLRQVYVLASED